MSVRHKRYASIDIGTNTARLNIIETRDKGALYLLLNKNVITRLGGDYSDAGGIAHESANRAIAALKAFAGLTHKYGVTECHAVATSVVRNAVNRDAFLDRIYEETSFNVRVISGKEEARLSSVGVMSVLKNASGRWLVIDIGGGSTEFIAIEEGYVVGSWSISLGVVHLHERFIKSDPPSAHEMKCICERIRSELKVLEAEISSSGVDIERFSGKGGARFAGTAGTVTTLAAIDQQMLNYDPARINNYMLGSDLVRAYRKQFASMTEEKRGMIPGLETGREDLIVAGTSIVDESISFFGFDGIVVSDSGLLEGILIDKLYSGQGKSIAIS